jgi:hypothetical protein
LRASLDGGKLKLSGSFGAFYSGHLLAHFYDQHGRAIGMAQLIEVDPSQAVSLETEILPPATTSRLSIHLVDESGVDRGALQEVQVGNHNNQ